MTSTCDATIALLPGMGADARLFQSQRDHFENLSIPDWLPPQRRESLSDYAKRMAEQLPATTAFIGGCSFGGMVAVEMARYFPAKACVLIASVRSPSQLPKRIRMWRPFAPLTPVSYLMSQIAARSALLFGRFMRPATQSFWKQLSEVDRQFFQWATRAVLEWKADMSGKEVTGERPQKPDGVLIYQIHGGSDHILPCSQTQPDEVVPGGGHLLPLKHGDAVNAFIERVIAETMPEFAE